MVFKTSYSLDTDVDPSVFIHTRIHLVCCVPKMGILDKKKNGDVPTTPRRTKDIGDTPCLRVNDRKRGKVKLC